MKILLPNTMSFHLDVPDDVEQVIYDAQAPVPEDQSDADAIVLWGSSIDNIRTSARRLPHVKLVQGLMAGPDFLPGAGFPADAALCTGVGLHGPMVSEHAMALTLALVRHLPVFFREQQQHRWRSDMGGMRHFRPGTGAATSLRGTKVVVWGFGDLGQSYAAHAANFGADVVGIARSAGERAGFPVTDDPTSVLPEAQILVLCLPDREATRQIVDADTLAILRDGVLIVNVGRGSAIDSQALADALRSGKVAGAALDVTDPEPLPEESPLWDLPGVIITPHAAGGLPIGYDELISRNVRHLLAGEPCDNLLAD